MAETPTYEELKQRVLDLEQQVSEISFRTKALEFTQLMVDRFPGSICFVGADATFVSVNEAACRALGFPRETLLKMTIHDIAPDFPADTWADHWAEVKAQGSFVVEAHHRNKDGKIFPIEVIGNYLEFDGKEYHSVFVRDITARKQFENSLIESEERLALAVEATKDAIWDLDIAGNRAYASPRCVELMAIHEDASLEETFRTYISRIHKDHRRYVKSCLREFMNGNAPYEVEYLYCYDNGETRWLHSQGKALFNEKGEAARIVGSTRDITKRKKAEETLRKSEEEYRNLFDSVPDPVLIVQENLELLLNRSFTKLLGYHRQDFENGLSPFAAIKEDEDKKKVRERIKKRLAGEEVIPKFHTLNLISKEGKTILCESSGTSIQYNGRPAVLVVFRDVTERIGAEGLIRKLTHQLIKSQEIERRMVSSELNDRVGKNLITSRIECDMLVANESLPPDTRQRISVVSDILRTTQNSVYDLSYELKPPSWEEQGLIHVLHDYCNKFSENNKVEVDFRFAGIDKLKLSVDMKINLYRLVQEGLNNIWKHANASEATIKLTSSFSKITLHIEDNGRGFNVKKRLAGATDEKKMGLRNMEEKVILLHGSMNVQSVQGKGTTILIEIPHRKDHIQAGESDSNGP